MHHTVCAVSATGSCSAALESPRCPQGACGVALAPPLQPLDVSACLSAASLPVTCSPLFRLFFPLTLLEADRGWLVGWGLPDGTAVACSLLPPLPLHLIALFLQQLNERLLKSGGPRRPDQRTCSDSSNGCSDVCTNSNSSSSTSRSKAGDESDLVFDYRVLPQPVQLIGWWRGPDLKATCPFSQTEVLLSLQQQQDGGRPGFEERNSAVWLDLWLEVATGLPVPLSIVSHIAEGTGAADSAGAAVDSEARSWSIVQCSGADTAAGEGPPAATAAPAPPTATASPRSVVFLYRLPSWVSSTTLAAAPHDAAQASAAAAFVQRPKAAQALLRQVAQDTGTGGQQQQQPQLLQQQRGDGTEQLCGFEAYLTLLNVSAAVYASIQQQLHCWRLLQLRQQAESGATAETGAAGTVIAGGCRVSRCRVALQPQQRGECGSDLSMAFSCRARVVGYLAALLELLCYVLLSAAYCVGTVCRAVSTLRLWRPFASPGSNLWLSASLQQIVLRFRICASWPEALSRKRRFDAALEDCSRREQQQQQQQTAAAAASGALQLDGAAVPALVSPQPRLKRSCLPRGLSVFALCLYSGIVAVVVDVLLGLFLPQLLAVLIYRGIPADACSPEYLSRLKAPPPEPTALPPLWPVSLSEAAAPQLYPFPPEEEEQQQQHDQELEALEAVDERAADKEEEQPRHDKCLAVVAVAGRSQKVQDVSRERRCSSAAVFSPAMPPASGGGARAAGATAAAAGPRGGGVVSRSPPSWRELMVEPTSTLLLRLFSGCYCFLHVDLLTAHVQWLMDFPAGLKLNANLTWVLGSVVLTASHLWNDLTAYLHSAVATAEQRKRGLLLQLQQLQLQLQQHHKQHGANRQPPPGLLQSLSETIAAVSHMLRSLLWQEEPSAPTNSTKLASPHEPSAPSSNSSSSKSLWSKFVLMWSACHLWLKTGLGSVLMTFRLGWLGLSASLFAAASADLLMVGTLHIFYVYLVCARLLHVNLKSLHSLFLLFRGQKWNVLRRRVDSADLQMDQLLIGCILFTITVCLFPTTLVFYISYLLLWLLIFGTHALLRLAVCLFLAYPTCLLAFRAASPHLLAAGVSFDPVTALSKQTRRCSSSGNRSNSNTGSTGSTGSSSDTARCSLLHQGKFGTRTQAPADSRTGAAAEPDPAGGAAAVPAARSSDNIYFMLRARPISYGDILWPPVLAAARNTLTPLYPSNLLPKILQGDIIRLSSHNNAWSAVDS